MCKDNTDTKIQELPEMELLVFVYRTSYKNKRKRPSFFLDQSH